MEGLQKIWVKAYKKVFSESKDELRPHPFPPWLQWPLISVTVWVGVPSRFFFEGDAVDLGPGKIRPTGARRQGAEAMPDVGEPSDAWWIAYCDGGQWEKLHTGADIRGPRVEQRFWMVGKSWLEWLTPPPPPHSLGGGRGRGRERGDEKKKKNIKIERHPVYSTTDESFRFHKKTFDKICCKLDSTQNPRSF